jgi:hypothetical protein
MKIQEVIDQALRDPVYAAELLAKAGNASRELRPGEAPSGEAWEALVGEFAETPAELARFMSIRSNQKDGTTTVGTTTTTTTFTTTTTLACTVTTTTTTTGTLTLTTTAVVEPE